LQKKNRAFRKFQNISEKNQKKSFFKKFNVCFLYFFLRRIKISQKAFHRRLRKDTINKKRKKKLGPKKIFLEKKSFPKYFQKF
jgi:hypothetical protein